MEEAITRIERICGDDLSGAKASFDAVRQHRNRLVHFYNEDYGVAITQGAKPNQLETVVAEQCRAWYHLHQLLTTQWKKIFEEFQYRIRNLNLEMLELRPYLAHRFATLQNDIAARKHQGEVFEVCPSCGYEASQKQELLNGLFQSKCLVCDRRSQWLELPCQEEGCDGKVIVQPEIAGCCAKCGEIVELKEVFSRLEPFSDPSDPESGRFAYCGECQCFDLSNGSVLPFHDKYLCVNCLELFDHIHTCEWCGEQSTDELEDSYLLGCNMCDGRGGWKDD